jgi:flagellar protein FlaG
METRAAAIAPAPDPAAIVVAASPAQQREPDVATGPDPVDMRLVIEHDQASGSFVYKTINRLTGEVIQQFPRAEILKLRSELTYAAGAVIKTEA